MTMDRRSAPIMTLSLALFEIDHRDKAAADAGGHEGSFVHQVRQIGAEKPGVHAR